MSGALAGGIEAAGDLATGAFAARVVESHAGEHGEAETGPCLNCGTALAGAYCHRCGQPGHLHSSLASIVHDLLHGVFHFEGKIWRTLPMLVTHPGALTRRYVAGERARFVSPLALFLFSVFLMFAVIHSVAGEIEVPENSPAGRERQAVKVERKIAQVQAELSQRQKQLVLDKAAGKDVEDASDRVATLQEKLADRREALADIRSGKAGDFVAIGGVHTNWAALDEGIRKANANPGLALYKLQSNAYKFSWALIPISVPFVALLFLWRRQYKLYDHAIFVIYSLDFMTLLVVALTLAGVAGVPAGLLAIVAITAPPVHIYKQLRGAYRLRRFSAAWRMVALLVFAWVALVAFLAFLLTLGLME